jgi:hypothetical protein
MAIDSTSSAGKKYKPSRQYRLLRKQTRLFGELLMKQHQLYDQLLVKQGKLQVLMLKQYKLMFGAGGAANEQMIDRLVEDLLTEEGFDFGATKESEDLVVAPGAAKSGLAGAQVRPVPAKTAPAAPPVSDRSSPSAPRGKAAPQDKAPVPEKAQVAPKPKPKPGKAEDAGPPLPTKYWIALGILIAVAGYCFWPGGGVPSASSLAKLALTAEKPHERVNAVIEMNTFDRKAAIPELRRLLKASQDPAVLEAVLTGLALHSDLDSVPELIVAMDNPEKKVRLAAFNATARTLGASNFQGLEFGDDDSAEKREPAKRRAKEIFDGATARTLSGPS